MITNFKIFENTEFKKYLVWQAKKIIMILEIINIAPYHIKFNKLYYIDNTNIVKKVKKETLNIFKDYEKIKSHILYEDDDLQTCIEMLKILKDTNKYNL